MPHRAEYHKPLMLTLRKKIREQYDRDRGTSHQRGYDMNWRKLRDYFITEFPLCAHCKKEGVVSAATEVDHIIPIAEGGERLDQYNLQSLCKPCHSRKTLSENR